jgi:hypothetical protein
VSAICANANASRCVGNIFQTLFVPYIPGDLLKMALVVATVPLAWVAVTAWWRWRHADAIRRAAAAAGDSIDDGGEAAPQPAVPLAAAAAAVAAAAAEPPPTVNAGAAKVADWAHKAS